MKVSTITNSGVDEINGTLVIRIFEPDRKARIFWKLLAPRIWKSRYVDSNIRKFYIFETVCFLLVYRQRIHYPAAHRQISFIARCPRGTDAEGTKYDKMTGMENYRYSERHRIIQSCYQAYKNEND